MPACNTYSVNKDICVSGAFVSSQPFSNLKTMHVCNTILFIIINNNQTLSYLLSSMLSSLLSPPVWISPLSRLTQPPQHELPDSACAGRTTVYEHQKDKCETPKALRTFLPIILFSLPWASLSSNKSSFFPS